MIETRFFDRDPLSGSTTLYHFNHAEQTFSFEERLDVEPMLDVNRAQHNAFTGANWKGDMHHVARLDLMTWFKLKKEGILGDQKAFRKWLDDPDNSKYRTRSGGLSRTSGGR